MSAGLGEVEIDLNDHNGEPAKFILKPSIKATKLLSRHQGGLMHVAERIMALDLDTMVSVIDLGVGFTERGKEKLADRIYERGMGDLAAPLIRYIHILINGGKPPKETGEVEGGEQGKD